MARTDDLRLIHEFMVRLDQSAETSPLAAMYELGLTMPQIVALDKVHREGPTSIGAIAERLVMSMSATSSLIQGLVERELITRTEDPNDRRQKLLALTAQGSKAIERLVNDRASAIKQVVSKLPSTLRDDLLEVVERVVMHFRNASK